MTTRRKEQDPPAEDKSVQERAAAADTDLGTDAIEDVQRTTERELGVSSEIRRDGSIAYFDAEKASLTREVGS